MAVSKRGGVTKVVMPKNTPKIKVNNVIRNGGDIIWCEPNQISRENTLKKLLLENSIWPKRSSLAISRSKPEG